MIRKLLDLEPDAGSYNTDDEINCDTNDRIKLS